MQCLAGFIFIVYGTASVLWILKRFVTQNGTIVLLKFGLMNIDM